MPQHAASPCPAWFRLTWHRVTVATINSVAGLVTGMEELWRRKMSETGEWNSTMRRLCSWWSSLEDFLKFFMNILSIIYGGSAVTRESCCWGILSASNKPLLLSKEVNTGNDLLHTTLVVALSPILSPRSNDRGEPLGSCRAQQLWPQGLLHNSGWYRGLYIRNSVLRYGNSNNFELPRCYKT